MKGQLGLMFALCFLVGVAAQGQTFTTLYNFADGSDGGQPMSGVIQGQYGDLYGATTYGGGSGFGVVYELSTAGKETVLHSFTRDPDGGNPYSPLIRDNPSNLYGTTSGGGSSPDCGQGGCGTVFKFDSVGNETILYAFTGGSDGCNPYQGLVTDKAGNLYGTTERCGGSDYGTIFKIDSAGTFTLLHTFAGGTSDGALPYYGRLTMDAVGNLYGVTPFGGSSGCPLGCGVLYRLSTSGMFTVLHSFANSTSDGCYAYGSVLRDKAGNLYGTTAFCGSSSNGTIWKVGTKGKETILHNFAGTSDGCYPEAGVTRDSKGNLYGVAEFCGANGYGTLYELSAKGKLTLLHSFDGTDGDTPVGEALRTAKGTLFGTTSGGGLYAYGTVWKYVPKKN